MEAVNELVAVFMEEADGRLKDLKSAVYSEINESNCEKARISSHTIKGMSSQMGYDRIAAVSKEIEKFFISVRDMKKLPSHKDMEKIKKGVTAVEKLFEELKNNGSEVSDISELLSELNRLNSSFKGE